MTLSLLVTGAILALPLTAGAQTTGSMGDHAMGDHMMGNAQSATMLCRKAAAGEKASAMMVDGNTPIVCKLVDPAMMMKGPSSPDVSKALTTQQVNSAWAKWLTSISSIPPTGGG